MNETQSTLTVCRRCASEKVIQLDKRAEGDNQIYPCARCGFIFSPSHYHPSKEGPGGKK